MDKQGQGSQDRRKDGRFPVQVKAVLKTTGGHEFKGETKDLSAFGALFVPIGDKLPEAGSSGSFAFMLTIAGEKSAFVAGCYVANINPKGVGVEFPGLSQRNLELLEEYFVDQFGDTSIR